MREQRTARGTRAILAIFFFFIWSGVFSEKAQTEPTYVVVKKEVIDNRLKTQVLLTITIPIGISKGELERLLGELSREQLATTGYKHHRSPTHVAIYAYHSREYAADGSGWVGRLMKMGEDKAPDIIVREDLLAELRKPAEVKEGIPENARRRIYWEMVEAEDRADKEAQRMYPLTMSNYNPSTAQSILLKQNKMKQSLSEEYKKIVMTKHKITKEQWDRISLEGSRKQWPTPEP